MKNLALHLTFFHSSLSFFCPPSPPSHFALGQEEFTERDVEVFRRYLTFCGIGTLGPCRVPSQFRYNFIFSLFFLCVRLSRSLFCPIYSPVLTCFGRHTERTTFREQRPRV